MQANAWTIRGVAGRLKTGSRLAALFGNWEASHQDGETWRITVKESAPDPYWLEHGTRFRAVLEMGRGSVTGPAEIVSTDPLVIDMEIHPDDSGAHERQG